MGRTSRAVSTGPAPLFTGGKGPVYLAPQSSLNPLEFSEKQSYRTSPTYKEMQDRTVARGLAWVACGERVVCLLLCIGGMERQTRRVGVGVCLGCVVCVPAAASPLPCPCAAGVPVCFCATRLPTTAARSVGQLFGRPTTAHRPWRDMAGGRQQQARPPHTTQAHTYTQQAMRF